MNTGGTKIVSAITEVCRGPEEFAAFIIQKLVNSIHEGLRCVGLRLLTHFYLRVDLLPVSLLMMTLERKSRRKSSIISRTMEKISMISGGVGMKRLEASGGLDLLDEVLSNHSDTATEKTYAVLLEMLLTKSGSKTPLTVQYINAPEEYSTASASLHLIGASCNLGVGYVPNRMDPKGGQGGRSAVFGLSPDQMMDEGLDLLNAVSLSFVLDQLPRLPIAGQGQICKDLMTLLTHSGSNRDAFFSNPSWHLCLSGLVSNLIEMGTLPSLARVTTQDIVSKFRDIDEGNLNIDKELILNNEGSVKNCHELDNAKDDDKEVLIDSVCNNNVNISTPTAEIKDVWFAVGMKIYSTLLIHAMDVKTGWKEVERTLYSSLDKDDIEEIQKIQNKIGNSDNSNEILQETEKISSIMEENELKCNSIARSILSHCISEMTFSIKPKYKDLQRLAKSTKFKENQAGLDRMENILTLILSSSQFSLFDVHCAGKGVGDLRIGRLRAFYYNEVKEEKVMLEKMECANATSQDNEWFDDDAEGALRWNEGVEGVTGSKERITVTDSSSDFSTPVGKSTSTGVERGVMRDLYESKEETPSNLFDHAENRLLRRCERDDSFQIGEGYQNNDGYECLKFDHIWIELITAKDKEVGVKGVTKDDTKTTFSRKDVLSPLERSHDVEEGRLILVLQTLRLFDGIFWPHKSGPFRNKHMLRFIKDQVPLTARTAPLTARTDEKDSALSSTLIPTSIKSELNQNLDDKNQDKYQKKLDFLLSQTSNNQNVNTASSPNSTPRNNTPTDIKKNVNLKNDAKSKILQSYSPSISFYTSIIRMSLYILQTLSPSSELAILNVQRLNELLMSQDKVSPYTTPIDDWLLAAVLHLTVTLQNILSSLKPIFEIIGFKNSCLNIPIIGFEIDDEVYEMDLKFDKEVISKLDISIENKIKDLFNTSIGVSLIAFTKECMLVLSGSLLRINVYIYFIQM
jgi:hypothetical protein